MSCFCSGGRKGPIHLDDKHVARAEACHATIQKSRGLYHKHCSYKKSLWYVRDMDVWLWIMLSGVITGGGLVLVWSYALSFPPPPPHLCFLLLSPWSFFLCDLMLLM